MRTLMIFMVLGSCAVVGQPAWATSITIANPSFENISNPTSGSYTLLDNNYLDNSDTKVHDLSTFLPVTGAGYTVDGNYQTDNDKGGAYNPDNSANLLNINGVTGNNVGYLNGNNNGMFQVLGATLQAGIYTFSADLGYPNVGAYTGGNTAVGLIELRVGTTELSSPIATGSVGAGTLATLTKTYVVSPLDPNIGSAINVDIIKTSGNASLYFDNLSLNYYTAVPEPASGALLALGMGVILGGYSWRRRRAIHSSVK